MLHAEDSGEKGEDNLIHILKSAENHTAIIGAY